jgi:hypothetical protein
MLMQAGKDYIIVDNFYKDPQKVREFAASIPFTPKGVFEQNFAGIESERGYFTEAVILKLEASLSKTISVNSQKNAFGKFRLSKACDTQRTRVHVDDTEYTAIVYLTPEEHCSGGTTFYRHIPSGAASVSELRSIVTQKGQHFQDFSLECVLEDTLALDRWEVIGFYQGFGAFSFVDQPFRDGISRRATHT